MLQAFTVDNFKSLVNVDFQPRGLNLLIGANNAGKTSLCQALRFLSLTSSLSLDDAATQCTAEPWNLLNVYLKNQRLSFTATCVLTLGGDQLNFRYELVLRSNREPRLPPRRPLFAVESESLKVSGGGFSDTTLLENSEGAVRLLHERRFVHLPNQNPDALYVATNAPTDATMLFRLYNLETNQRSNLFKRYLAFVELLPTSIPFTCGAPKRDRWTSTSRAPAPIFRRYSLARIAPGLGLYAN